VALLLTESRCNSEKLLGLDVGGQLFESLLIRVSGCDKPPGFLVFPDGFSGFRSDDAIDRPCLKASFIQELLHFLDLLVVQLVGHSRSLSRVDGGLVL
jgi:hypothetical protein